jgi:predicted alpha/beta-hydrolase family hydrolase
MNGAAIKPFEDHPHSIRGFLHIPAVASGNGLVLTHGAGGNCESPLLTAVAGEFCASGFSVLRCDLPFRQLRPHGPPPRGSAERDQQGLREAAASLRSLISGRLFLGGHSYGGRQASILAAAQPGLVDGLVLLS